MGDTDNHLLEDHLKELEGNVDVLLAHADAHATIAPDELDKVITRLKTKAVIPMHYDGAKGVLKIEPVETFLGHCKPENVTRVKGSTLDLTGATLPKSDTPHIYVLEQSKLR